MRIPRTTRAAIDRDPAVDFQVDDIVLCKVHVKGLQVGRVYPVYAVYRRRVWTEIWTTVTVNADFKLVEVSRAETFLRCTQLQITERSPDGQDRTHVFRDAAELEEWRVRSRIPPEALYALRYVEVM